MEIIFKEPTKFLGRNGWFKCTGISIGYTVNGVVDIEPITSKGCIGRCAVEVPFDKDTLTEISKEFASLAVKAREANHEKDR